MKETLKALREQFNYSQNAVAKFLGISRQMYIKYENGEAEPPVKTVVALSGLYKVPYDFLIDNRITRQITRNEHKEVEYKIPEHKEKILAVADPGADYNVEESYSATLVSMFTKLAFIKQLEVFSELAGIIQKSSKEEASTKLETKKEKSPLEKIWERQKMYPGHSDGWKWNREELYE
ncbi:helix-turn-helix domain-containing protein [Treponema sp.]|uniref:helix-turn-helix transcriptional regulator n=1 Tax=Treponema sp. TaxID=166 RepID=UPI00298E46B7|nr:helix-turn-helix domain-containing protein [Treponema sp.]MCQ2241698.1 helix-turn-helix domain-containing protein [Treponema sp.]